MGVFIILLALWLAKQEGKGIFEIMLDVGALLMSPIQIPLMWGLFIKRTPPWAALLSIGCAFTVSAMAFIVSYMVAPEVPLTFLGFAPKAEWTFQMKFFGVLAAGSFGFLISTLFAPAKDSPHRTMVDAFITNMKTPIDFEEEVGEGNDLAQLKTIGYFGGVVSVFIALLLIIPNPPDGRLAILALALIIGSVSALMIRAGSKAVPPKP